MNDLTARTLFLLHIGSTLYMVGLIWFVQVVHYPLLANIGKLEFPAYEHRHTQIVTWVVGPPMLIEGATAVLLFWLRPTGVTPGALVIGLALLVVIWLSTAFIQVPCHAALTHDFDPLIHQRLVTTNWLRTVAWSARGILFLWMI